MVWVNYESPCNSIVALYLKGTCARHISYHGNAQGPQKMSSKFQFS